MKNLIATYTDGSKKLIQHQDLGYVMRPDANGMPHEVAASHWVLPDGSEHESHADVALMYMNEEHGGSLIDFRMAEDKAFLESVGIADFTVATLSKT